MKRLPGDIYHILVNTTHKWVPYELNPVVPNDGYVDLSFPEMTVIDSPRREPPHPEAKGDSPAGEPTQAANLTQHT